MKLVNQILEVYQKKPRIAILMSGTGTNAEVILQERSRYPNLHFVTLFTDNPNSRAEQIAQNKDLDWKCLKKQSEGREGYFLKVSNYLKSMQVDTLIYAGFMKITPSFFLQTFPGINIHPADLTLLNESGVPRYIGRHAVRDAIEGGETSIASTVHIVDSDVDCGQPLMISSPLQLTGDRDPKQVQEALKQQCEYRLFPEILERLASGHIVECELPIRLS